VLSQLLLQPGVRQNTFFPLAASGPHILRGDPSDVNGNAGGKPREPGRKVNPKRVYQPMREDNLLCVRKRKLVVTTDSNHERKVYPNLPRDMFLTAVNQLWRPDITTSGGATSSCSCR
jgi:hypothetical protein